MFTACGDPAASMQYFEKSEKLAKELQEKGEIGEDSEAKTKEQLFAEAT